MRMVQLSHEEIVQICQEAGNTLDKTVSDIVHLLDKRSKKIATAESCTGGMLSQLITSVSGASSIFELGLCTYSDAMKERFLHVPKGLLDTYGAVSAQVAGSMARGLSELSGAELCISVTGFAGPGGGTEKYPVGTVFVAVKYKDHMCVAHLELYRFCEMQRSAIRKAAAVCVFGIALKMLKEC